MAEHKKVLWTDDFILAISKGDIPGHRIMRGLGERDAIQITAAGEDMWRGNELSAVPAALGSHTFIPRPADAGEQMTLICENAGDALGGIGVRSVEFHYIDDVGDEQEEFIETDGLTGVDTVATNIRFIQEVHSTAVGSNTAAVGNIRIYRKSDASRVYSMIYAGTNMSIVPHRMVPKDKTLHLRTWTGSESSSQKQIRLRLRFDADNNTPPVLLPDVFLLKSGMALNSSSATVDLGYTVPAFSVVKVSAWVVLANGEAACHWWGVLVDDDT